MADDRSFYPAFFRVLPWRPRQAFSALFWQLTGRRVRARNRLRIASEQSPLAYQLWIDDRAADSQTLDDAEQVVRASGIAPFFSVIADHCMANDPNEVARLFASLAAQNYSAWELLLPMPRGPAADLDQYGDRVRAVPCDDGDAAALAAGIAAASGDFVLPLPRRALLPPTALLRYAATIQAAPECDALFGDHDLIDSRGKRWRPWLKPQWNERMFLAQDYLTQACVIRTETARAAQPIGDALGGVATYALLLRIIAQGSDKIAHVPHIQCHLREGEPDDANQAARRAAVAWHLAKLGTSAHAEFGPFGTVSVRWPLPADLPFVSIIVPTRDKVKLLRACVDGVLERTSYGNFELLIVDNGSTDPETLRYLDRIARQVNVEVLPYYHPYNFSAINNYAVDRARGDYICLLNNDTEVIDSNWLTELMRQSVEPTIGAVGAKLLYGDGSIQHAGVVIGMGDAAGHAHRFLRKDARGYFARAHVAHFVSAVTAACLVVEKRKFQAVGGLDEDALRIAFNDVDLCMKLERAGWRNVYEPRAVMIHHESKSRGNDIAPQHIQRYLAELEVLQSRWGTKSYQDPLHHPDLDRYSETYILRLSTLRGEHRL